MAPILHRSLFIAGTSLFLASCASLPGGAGGGFFPASSRAARAELEARSESRVLGAVTLTPVGDKVRLEVRAIGLAPGAHGFHIHEAGDCSAPDAISAKGHFNPFGKAHGQHAGDLPNLVADASGKVAVSVELSPQFKLTEGNNGVIGRSVIIHANGDDFVSPAEGNSGRRIACGIIRAR